MFPIADECKDIFTAIKLRHQYAYAIMKIENRKEIVLEKYSNPLPDNTQETNEVIFNKMKEDLVRLGEARFILFDVRFTRRNGFTKKVAGYMYWCPDDLNVWEKTIYARTNGFLRAEFEGIENFEYHDEEEFNFQELVKKLRAKDNQ